MQFRIPFVRFQWLFVLLVLLSCTNKNSPGEVAKAWLNDFHNLDFEDAKKYATDETKNTLSLAQLFLSTLPDSVKKQAKTITVEIKATKENGDKAIVSYTVSKNPQKEETLNLVKVNDKWLVQFTKNDMNAEARTDTTSLPQIIPDTTQSLNNNTADSLEAPEDDTDK